MKKKEKAHIIKMRNEKGDIILTSQSSQKRDFCFPFVRMNRISGRDGFTGEIYQLIKKN